MSRMTKKHEVLPASAPLHPLMLPSPLPAVCFVYTGPTGMRVLVSLSGNKER